MNFGESMVVRCFYRSDRPVENLRYLGEFQFFEISHIENHLLSGRQFRYRPVQPAGNLLSAMEDSYPLMDSIVLRRLLFRKLMVSLVAIR